jgi:hypothetical protein
VTYDDRVIALTVGAKPAVLGMTLQNRTVPIGSITVDNSNSPLPCTIYRGSGVPTGVGVVVPAGGYRTIPGNGAQESCVQWSGTPAITGSAYVYWDDEPKSASSASVVTITGGTITLSGPVTINGTTTVQAASDYPIGATPFCYALNGIATFSNTNRTIRVPVGLVTLTTGQRFYLTAMAITGLARQALSFVSITPVDNDGATILAPILEFIAGVDINLSFPSPIQSGPSTVSGTQAGFSITINDTMLGNVAVDAVFSGYIL